MRDDFSALARLGILKEIELNPCPPDPESLSTLERVDATELARSAAGPGLLLGQPVLIKTPKTRKKAQNKRDERSQNISK